MGRRAIIDWVQFESLLGTMSDQDLADKIGCSMSSVRCRRQRKGVDAFNKKPNLSYTIDWSDWIAFLGTMPDKELALLMKCSPQSVSTKRSALGIEEYRQPVNSKKILSMLGSYTDDYIAETHGVSPGYITKIRNSNGISTVRERFLLKHKHLLGTMPDKALAKKLKISPTTIFNWRKKLDISSYRSLRS